MKKMITELNVKAVTKRTLELYKKVKKSPGKCVIKNGELRVLFNTQYQKEKAIEVT